MITTLKRYRKFISYCLKLSGARQIVYKKDYDEPCDSDADYDSDPEPETEPDYDRIQRLLLSLSQILTCKQI